MRKHFLLWLMLILSFLMLNAQPHPNENVSVDTNLVLNKTDSLYQNFNERLKTLENNQLKKNVKIAEDNIGKANLIIDWSAMMFTLLTILLVLAGALGIREFSKVQQTEHRIRETERTMLLQLEEIKKELNDIQNYKSELIKDIQLFIQSTYYLNYSRQSYRAGDYSAAKEALYNLLDLESNNLDALSLLGKSLMMEGNIEESTSIFDKMLTVDSQNPDAYYGLAMNYFYTDLNKSKDFCEKALEGNPTHFNSLIFLSVIYRELGRVEEALRISKKAQGIKQYAVNSFYIAVIHYSRGEEKRARKYFDEANFLAKQFLERVDRWSWGLFIVAVQNGLNNNLKESEIIIRSILEINPSNFVRNGMIMHLNFILQNKPDDKIMNSLLAFISDKKIKSAENVLR